LLPRPGFAVEATGLLRASPELAIELAAIFDDVDDAGARSLVLDLLASAGTTQAQHVMIDLLSRPELRDEPAFPAWLQRFAFVRRPVPEAVTLLVDVADESAGSPAGRAALYPLGAVARRVAADEPLIGAVGHAVLLEAIAAAREPDDAIAALAGLGNEAHDDALEPLLAHVDHPDFGVRMQAASGLRYQLDPRGREALFELLRDDDDAVARTALVALADHQLGAEAATQLADATIRGAFNPAIAGALVGELGRRVDDAPAVRQALASLAASVDDANVRTRVGAVLALPSP
jgi:HEAT repeat protein